jgi:predicted HAD superfamily hydrolase
MPYFNFILNPSLAGLIVRGIEISLVTSLVFDIYKKSVLYLSYSDDNFSPQTFEKKKKILTFILITVQLSLGIITIAMVVGTLRAVFVSRSIYALIYWNNLSYATT